MRDDCGTDCKLIQRRGLETMPRQMWQLMWSRKLEQHCDQCGRVEPAGGMCSQCGHFPDVHFFYDQRQNRSEAQKQAIEANRLKGIAHRASDKVGQQ